MNIGIGGAILLWLLMLWPIIVTVCYYLLLRPQLSNAPATGFASIIVGYAAMLGIMMLTDLFERWVVEVEMLAVVIPWIAPMVTTHTIAVVASMKQKNT
jgi:hypothetical protein